MKFVVLLGRIFFSTIFILAAPGHFTAKTIHYAAIQGVFLPQILVPLSGIMILLGGLSVLLGFRAKLGAWILVLFLIPVTFVMHKFWSVNNPNAAAIEQIMFLKNIALMGGSLIIAYFGSGPLSIRNS